MRTLGFFLGFVVAAAAGCGDDSGGGGGGGDAAPADGSGADGVAATDGPASDGGGAGGDAFVSTCSGLERPACEANDACVPACTNLCDCACPMLGDYEQCGCEGCPATCFTYAACLDGVPCGEGAACDRATEICVHRAGGIGIVDVCEPVPTGCEDDRSCACVKETLCPGTAYTCSEAGDDAVSCDCLPCAHVTP